ncbi:hypothetical protein HQ545_03430 [Candidatus Woesearchaeota archaeon]|nr:hypothetical protein [Candidatus Woesearchaeota archaeon]
MSLRNKLITSMAALYLGACGPGGNGQDAGTDVGVDADVPRDVSTDTITDTSDTGNQTPFNPSYSILANLTIGNGTSITDEDNEISLRGPDRNPDYTGETPTEVRYVVELTNDKGTPTDTSDDETQRVIDEILGLGLTATGNVDTTGMENGEGLTIEGIISADVGGIEHRVNGSVSGEYENSVNPHAPVIWCHISIGGSVRSAFATTCYAESPIGYNDFEWRVSSRSMDFITDNYGDEFDIYTDFLLDSTHRGIHNIHVESEDSEGNIGVHDNHFSANFRIVEGLFSYEGGDSDSFLSPEGIAYRLSENCITTYSEDCLPQESGDSECVVEANIDDNPVTVECIVDEIYNLSDDEQRMTQMYGPDGVGFDEMLLGRTLRMVQFRYDIH